MRAQTVKLVKFGDGGDVVYLADEGHYTNCTSSGYGTPGRPHAADFTQSHNNYIVPDGTIALDIRPALETTEGFHHVFSGPMVNVNLADDQISECPTPDPIFASAMSENAFGSLLAMQQAQKTIEPKKPGALDCVSIREFVAGWVALGAKVGTYKNKVIIWQ